MGGKFPHPSATGGNLRPRNAPTVPRVPRLGDFSRHLRGTAWCFEEHLSTHVEMKPEKIRPRGFTRNKTQMGLGGRSLKEKVIWLLRDPFPEIYHIIYRHILYYMRYMLQYVPPPKKKEIYHFWWNALTRGPVTDDVNCQGRKKHRSSHCSLPVMSKFPVFMESKGSLPNATPPNKKALLRDY